MAWVSGHAQVSHYGRGHYHCWTALPKPSCAGGILAHRRGL